MTSAHALTSVLAASTEASEGIAECALLPLTQYDSAHSGDLVNTLYVYLSLGCNATRAADMLYLHRSGLLYRLHRIEDLLGVSIGDYHTRLALGIAFLAKQSNDK